ncbi:hypothetical protein IQ17_04527 [Bradyrhizobium daqingense]|uniref:Four helix bundle sensory module for signal transduction n=1 Tax=Bradyrhizobium daqingense TaxID=993502 RepID=A0A562L1H3_9BRAD|nr:hypothetical protein IQ17_04527 [Bradyrhizobium daqingense]
MKFRLSLSSAIIAFGIVLAIGFTAVVSTSLYTLRELKVGGPLYSDIKLGNDLIADILPPPEYIIEAYLEATLAMREPDQLAAHGERLVQLRKDYDERKAFWVSSSLAADLKTALVSKSDAEVQKFWKASDQLLPASRPRMRPLPSAPMRSSRRPIPRIAPSSTALSRTPTSRMPRWRSWPRTATARCSTSSLASPPPSSPS